MTAFLALLVASLLGGAAAPAPARAGADPAAAGEGRAHVAVALLAEPAAIAPGTPFRVGLRMVPERGWHTYWKNPGDAGLPLRIEWRLPDGFTAGPIEWPAPERIPANSLVSYGYGEAVLLPIEIVPPESLAVDSVTIAGKFDWLECSDVCVPGSAMLRLTLPVRRGATAPGRAAAAFAEARARIPEAPDDWTFTAEAGPRTLSLAFAPPAGIAPRGAYFFPEEPLVAEYAAPQGFERIGGVCRLTITPAANAPLAPERLTGVLVVDIVGGAGRDGAPMAFAVDVPLRAGDPDPAPAQTEPESARAPDDSSAPLSPDLQLILLADVVVALLLIRTASERGTGTGSP